VTISELMQARYRGDLATVERLRAAGHVLDVHEAAAVGDDARLGALLLEDGSLVAAWSEDGAQPLHFAAYFGHVPCVRQLLDRGADPGVHARGFNGVAPINAAAANDQKPNERCTEIVRLLLDAGAGPAAAQGGGSTALDAARHAGNAELERLLE
jgi:ankyrin repeat protein